MKLSTEEILDKEFKYMGELLNFISSLDLTSEQMEFLADRAYWAVRWGLAKNPNLTEELMIKLSCDVDWTVHNYTYRKLKKLNSLSSEDLESAYDLIRKSKYIRKERFEETFDYISNKFPELSELAKMFKRIILKGKKDLK